MGLQAKNRVFCGSKRKISPTPTDLKHATDYNNVMSHYFRFTSCQAVTSILPDLLEHLTSKLHLILTSDVTSNNVVMNTIDTQKLSGKRKRKLAQLTALDKTRTVTVTALDVDCAEQVLKTLYTCLQYMSQFTPPGVLHKVFNILAFVGIKVFSVNESIGLMNVFKHPSIRLMLVKCLNSVIACPNLKCSPPVAMVAHIYSMSQKDSDETIREETRHGLNNLSSVLKPNFMPAFTSIALKYEPKIETVDSYVQACQKVESRPCSVQTDTITSSKARSFNTGCQTDASSGNWATTESTPVNAADCEDTCKDMSTNENEADEVDDDAEFLEMCNDFVPT